MDKQVVKYNVTKAEIAKMADIYLALTITDLEDQEQFDQVHSARMVMVKHRTRAEKMRTDANAEALKFQRNNNKNAKELINLMEPIETHLKTEEKKVTDEEKRIKAEREEALLALIKDRVDALYKVGYVVSFEEAGSYTLDFFHTLLRTESKRFEAEKEALAKEAADRKAEDERLEKVRKEQEAEAERLRLENQRMTEERAEEAERVRLAQQKIDDEKQRVIDEQQKKEIDRLLAEELIEHKKQDAIDKKVAEKKEKERKEAQRPDMEKLKQFGEELLAIGGPELSNPELQEFLAFHVKAVHNIGKEVKLYVWLE